MKKFAQLLELLALTPSRNRKIEAMTQYFAATPDPDRGYALAILTGALTFKNVKPAVLRDVVTAEVDPILFGMSYDYVGDLGETIALICRELGLSPDWQALAQEAWARQEIDSGAVGAPLRALRPHRPKRSVIPETAQRLSGTQGCGAPDPGSRLSAPLRPG